MMHPDFLRRKGYRLQLGRRYQLARDNCHVVAASIASLTGGRCVAARFFTSDLPDDPQRDRTGFVVASGMLGGGASMAPEDVGAHFPYGVFVELYDDSAGDSALPNSGVIVVIGFVERAHYAPAFGDARCWLAEEWKKSACREGTDLWTGYDRGGPAPAWEPDGSSAGGTPGATGMGWVGDGEESLHTEDGCAIITEAGEGIGAEIEISDSTAFSA